MDKVLFKNRFVLYYSLKEIYLKKFGKYLLNNKYKSFIINLLKWIKYTIYDLVKI